MLVLDNYETGLRAGKPLFAMLRGAARPTLAWGNRPMLPHVMRMGTDEAPMRDLVRMAERFARGAVQRRQEVDAKLRITRIEVGCASAAVGMFDRQQAHLQRFDLRVLEAGHAPLEPWGLREPTSGVIRNQLKIAYNQSFRVCTRR